MKIVSRNGAKDIAAAVKATGRKVVFTNGCFDILHAGHVRYLAAARALGDLLIVGLNSDRSVKGFKGADRPINPQDDRAEVLAALAAVDHVVIFDDRTAEGLVAEIKPDIYVKGGDYSIADLPEAAIVAGYGGRTVLVPEVPGRSSSTIIGKIKETASRATKG
jgi:rfaE bifunctional protein nucleotidyltransferase chain/domain